MTTEITVIYDTPQHPATFEAAYARQLMRIGHIPNLQHLETHRVWPTGHSNPTLAYRLVEMRFDSSAALREAAATLLPHLLDLGTHGVHIVYHDRPPTTFRPSPAATASADSGSGL